MIPSMMLVTSGWKNTKTFRLIPVTTDCPYNEAIFDMDERILAVIAKERKQSFHMMAKLDENGDPVRTKKPRMQGQNHAEERRTLETFYEYYLENPDEVKKFVNMMAVNSSEFDYAKFMEEAYNGDAKES